MQVSNDACGGENRNRAGYNILQLISPLVWNRRVEATPCGNHDALTRLTATDLEEWGN